MKPINLISLISAKDQLTNSNFELYLSNFEASIRDSEIEDLRSLLLMLIQIEQDQDILDSYFVGFTISQIGKEFDLLRFGENEVINIELKRKNTGKRIKEQLLRNSVNVKHK